MHKTGKASTPARLKQRTTPEEITALIDRLRHKLGGLSQADLARRVGVWPQTISDWQSGRRNPKGPLYRKLLQLDADAENTPLWEVVEMPAREGALIVAQALPDPDELRKNGAAVMRKRIAVLEPSGHLSHEDCVALATQIVNLWNGRIQEQLANTDQNS